MLRDDVLMRQIRKLVEALLAAARHRREKDQPRAESTVDDVIESELGLSVALLEAVAPSTLLDLVSPGGALDVERALALGLLLAEKAAATGAERWREKARALLERAGADDVERLLDDEDARLALAHAMQR